MSEPVRIQYKRGHKLPEGAKLVARPSKFGNVFRVGGFYQDPEDKTIPPRPAGPGAVEGTGGTGRIPHKTLGERVYFYTVRKVTDRALAVALYKAWAAEAVDPSGLTYPEMARRDLAGFDLACYCPLDGEPCHASILLEWANA